MNNKNYLVIIIILTALLGIGFSKTKIKPYQTIFLEFAGSGYYYSYNYENLFINFGEWCKFGSRLGLSFKPKRSRNRYCDICALYSFPIVIGSKKSKAEFTFSQSFNFADSNIYYTQFVPGVGYRYHSTKSKFNFRVIPKLNTWC